MPREEAAVDAAGVNYVLDNNVRGMAALCRELGLAPDAHVAAFAEYNPGAVWKLRGEGAAVRESALWYFATLGSVGYVRIAGGRVATSVWAQNDDYTNWWWDETVASDEACRRMYDESAELAGYRPGGPILPRRQWSATGHILRMHPRRYDTMPSLPWWMPMVAEAAARSGTDCEFIINTEDFPRAPKGSNKMPWGLPVAADKARLAPFSVPANLAAPFSCCGSDGFLDRPIPTRDDWALSAEMQTATTAAVDEDWASRSDKAVFRGSPSGPAPAAEPNLRLRLVEMARARPDLLDAGITKWTSTMRIHRGARGPAAHNVVPAAKADRRVAEFIPIEKQARRFKYTVAVDGHVAPFRVPACMFHGILVLKPESKWRTWYAPKMSPWIHFVPVAADLSDLFEKIEWCRTNDVACRRIVRNAHRFVARHFKPEALVELCAEQLKLYGAKIAARPGDSLVERQNEAARVELLERSQPIVTRHSRLGVRSAAALLKELERMRGTAAWDALAAYWRLSRSALPVEPERWARLHSEVGRTRTLVINQRFKTVVESWPADSELGAEQAAFGLGPASVLQRDATGSSFPRFLHAQRLGDLFVIWREFVEGDRLGALLRLGNDTLRPKLLAGLRALIEDLGTSGYSLNLPENDDERPAAKKARVDYALLRDIVVPRNGECRAVLTDLTSRSVRPGARDVEEQLSALVALG